ncbi:hypothetical protein ACVIGA_000263 [Bradyrhizobium sp. USDA 3240]
MNRIYSAAFAAPLLLAPSLALAGSKSPFAAVGQAFYPTGTLIVVLLGLVLAAVVLPRSVRPFALVFAVLVGASLAIDVAFAADAAAPETVAQATSDTTKVTWAYGAAISQWASAIGTLILAFVTWLLRKLPAQIYAVIVSMRADQLISKGIDYAINMVKDATKDKALTVDVHNQVLAQALQYVLDHSPDRLTSWMGGPDAIAQKIIARLNLAPDAVPDVTAAVSSVSKT